MTLQTLLLLALALFCAGLYGVLSRRHLIGVLIGLESVSYTHLDVYKRQTMLRVA